MVNATGSSVINLWHHPFGNQYYATSACGGGPYNSTTRHCWAKACVGAPRPAADCFLGKPIAQHGPIEYDVDRMQACAKVVTRKDASVLDRYWPFVVCMEKDYQHYGNRSASMCADVAKIGEAGALWGCYETKQGDVAVAAEARATVDHPGTPYIEVDGKPIADVSHVLQAVCEAYTGVPKPAACKNAGRPRDHDVALRV